MNLRKISQQSKSLYKSRNQKVLNQISIVFLEFSEQGIAELVIVQITSSLNMTNHHSKLLHSTYPPYLQTSFFKAKSSVWKRQRNLKILTEIPEIPKF